MRLEGVAAQIQRRGLVTPEKSVHAAAVIIMAVGKDGEIHPGKVNAQFFGVVRKGAALAHVEENPMGTGFQVQAQTVLAGKVRGTGSIFDEGDEFHGDLRDFACYG